MKLFTKTSLAMILLLGVSTPNAFATDTWMVSTDSNCKVHNPEPQPNESVTWSGDCVDGYAHGYGKMQWHIHSELQGSYVGDYYQGKMHGKGTIKYANGAEYVGDWKDGKRHGKGTMKYTDGVEYTGDWQDDKRHGNGTITFADGEKYIGEWQNHKKHGKGLGITPLAIYYGDFVNGRYDGWGVWVSKDGGIIYEGQHKDGMMNGVGRYLFVNDASLHPDHKKYGYLQDNYVIRPAIFKDGYVDEFLTKKQHAKLVQKLGKQVQRPKEVLLPFRQYLTDPTPSKAQ